MGKSIAQVYACLKMQIVLTVQILVVQQYRICQVAAKRNIIIYISFITVTATTTVAINKFVIYLRNL